MAVVVGVDSSQSSVNVLEKAIAEAAMRDTELHVVHVFNPPVAYLEVPIDVDVIREAEVAAVWGLLGETIEGAGARVSRVDLEGYPPDTLVAYADSVGATLLVLGTRGRGELASLILGSTSNRALHLSKCDVLVVKSDAPEV